MGAKPDAPNFPKRNRIISGLCHAVVVVEAGEKSGALITANQAADQNRDVYAVPGNINSPKSIGPNRLIRDGARLYLNANELLEDLKFQLGRKQNNTRMEPELSLSPVEKKVFNILSDKPIHIDAIAKNCKLSTSQVLAVLLTLELNNVVTQLAGKMFVRN
jgi:DNA processing protein